jgi:GTP cyclohydrolase I
MSETQKLEEAIKTIIDYIGDDVARDELLATPKNVASYLKNMFCGYNYDFSQIESNLMENNDYEQMIIMDKIPFTSFCQHHMLPFTGMVKISYFPDKKIIGLGKLVKIVEAFSRKLQIQEKLTIEIANYINALLKARGVEVVIEANHSCIYMKNDLNEKNYVVKTSHMIGCLKENNEFFNKVNNYEL